MGSMTRAQSCAADRYEVSATANSANFRDCTASAPLSASNAGSACTTIYALSDLARSEEHTSELQSLMRISYAVFCLKKKKIKHRKNKTTESNEIKLSTTNPRK